MHLSHAGMLRGRSNSVRCFPYKRSSLVQVPILYIVRSISVHIVLGTRPFRYIQFGYIFLNNVLYVKKLFVNSM